MDYVIIGGGWILYLSVHSILASGKVKRFVAERIPFLHNKYRLFYTLLSSLGILVLCYLLLITPAKLLFEFSVAVKYMAMVIASWGVIILVVSFRHLSGMAFLGFRAEDQGRLVKKGLHGRIRHPIYSGTILVIIGMMLYVATDLVFLSGAIILAYLPFGIHFEEKKLIKMFGDDYLEYKAEVPAIIPKIG